MLDRLGGWRWAVSRARPERLYRLLGRLRAWTAAQRAWRRITAVGLDLPVAPGQSLFPGLSTDAAAGRLARDAALLAIARGHLGYAPRSVVARLYWSPTATLSDDERRDNGQTIDFHYEIERQPTLYLFFYLGDTDRGRGAHVVIDGSHRAKPLRLAWSATRQPEQALLAHYGPSRVVVLEGAAGFGFAEDPACFHKALPPLSGPRLVLQLRYS